MTKKNNCLIKITSPEGEVKYFTCDRLACMFIGCSTTAFIGIKSGNVKKFNGWKYDYVDGGEIKLKDIDNV